MSPFKGRYIKPNESSRLPGTFITLDVTSVTETGPNCIVHRFDHASMSYDRRSQYGNWWDAPEFHEATTPEEVWKWVTSKCRKRERTVIVAHNAGAVMRLSAAFSLLPVMGWTLKMFSLASNAAWSTWRMGTATLQIVDSLSWLPTSIDNLERVLPKAISGSGENTSADESNKCQTSTPLAVLRDAFLQIVDFLYDEDCGNWKPTGAGQGFAAFRHKHLTHKMLIHDHDEIKALERRAAWAGRAEAWRFGPQELGPYEEWDFSLAYCNIAAAHTVPVCLRGKVNKPVLDRILNHGTDKAYLCRVRVRTETPTLPTHAEGRIVWPVGEFETVVWSNELKMAATYGADIEILDAYAYHCAPALKQWANWVLSLVYDETGTVSPAVRIMAKGWARSVIGRFGSRYPNWERIGESRQAEPMLSGWSEYESGETGKLMEISGSAFLSLSEVDSSMAIPSVMSWIMAQCRVDLWSAMMTAGIENVVYVDTDSMILDRDGADIMRMSHTKGMRKKSAYATLDIIGTRRLVENGTLKAAGVPKGAVKLGPSTWSGEAWSSMAHDLASGRTDTVTVTERKLTLSDDDRRRRNAGNGNSEPYRIEV